MTDLRINRIEYRVVELLAMRPRLQLDPEYQREGQIWTLERQQLFIDSILNGFDVPPIYLHALRPPAVGDGRTQSYAVVDGRQRLEALWRFVDGQFGLAEDFSFFPREGWEGADILEEGHHPYGGLHYDDLFFHEADLRYRFDDYSVPMTIVETQEISLIEELFFRLNEGVPLTAAEKRNRGAVLREFVLPLIDEERLFDVVRFRRHRRSHADVLLRLLFLEEHGITKQHVPDLKKRALDKFASEFRPSASGWLPGEEAAARDRMADLVSRTRPVLVSMGETFEARDEILARVSDFIAYYITYRWLLDEGRPLPRRLDWQQLRDAVQSLRGESGDDLDETEYRLLDLSRPIQGSTTGSYYLERAQVFYDFAVGALQVS